MTRGPVANRSCRDGPGRRSRSRHLVPPLTAFVLVGGAVLILTASPWYSLAVTLGPMAGAAVRGGQSCCTENSLAIAPLPLGLLAVAFMVHRTVRPVTRRRRWLRSSLWWLASLGWFLSALLSYAHALS